MLAGAEHSCAMSCFFVKMAFHLSCEAHIMRTRQDLKLQSVSPLYNAQQGDLDVADARGGV
jgi:hypothetical protein